MFKKQTKSLVTRKIKKKIGKIIRKALFHEKSMGEKSSKNIQQFFQFSFLLALDCTILIYLTLNFSLFLPSSLLFVRSRFSIRSYCYVIVISSNFPSIFCVFGCLCLYYFCSGRCQKDYTHQFCCFFLFFIRKVYGFD